MHTKLIFSTVITFLLIPAIVFGLSRAALSQNNPINRDVNSRTTVVTPPPKLSTTISDQDYTLWKADGSQYCAYSDHTLEIEVDADPEDISDLSLIISAYDVDYRDESGDCEGGPEVDIVTINGNNLGNLVGANDSWSTTRFSVDPQLIMTGTNTVKIDTDATATDCWCVGIGYAALRGKVGDLQVMQVTPADKAVNVDWEQPDISAVFNVEIDPKSVDDTTVKLTDYWGQTTYSGTLSVGGNTIRFTPSPELPETGVRLKMTLKGGDSGIKGKGGAQLQQDYSWTFYTLPRLTVSIIPVQVVDDVNLVHNKPGVVRIKAVWDEFSDVDEVPVKITLSYSDGTSVTREPFVFYNEILTSVPAEYRRHGRSANFYSAKGEMPIITTPGTYTIKAVVEPAGQKVVPVKTFKADKSVAVNRYRIGYTSQTVNFRTRYVPLGLGGWTAGSTQDITAMAAASDRKLRKIYPVAKTTPRIETTVMEVSEPYVVTVKRVLRDLAQTNWFGPYNVVVGVVPKDWLIAYVGAVGVHANFFPGITTYAVLVADTASEVIAPHEIGHVYGLEHVDGYSLSGYDIERDLYINSKVKGHKYYLSALMDEYLASFGPSTVWISKSTYQELQNDLTAAPSRIALRREATLAQVIAVAGEIVQDGGAESATLDSVYVLDNVPIDNSAAGGDYALELQKTDGTILAAVAFSPVFETASDGKAYAPFLAGITYNADTGRVVIKKGATELGAVTRSSGSPTVDITSPLAGDVLSTAATLRWSASDPDGDSLTFTLLFSSDNGSSWDLLAQDISANDYTLDTTLMTGSDGCHVKVIVNDGFNTVQMLSGRFTVQNAPAVRATIPAADATDVAPGSPLTAIFRDAMDAASIDDSTFTLKDSSGTTLAGTVTYDAATREAVLTPVKPLKAATTFTAGITAAATSQTGLSLGSEYSWSFQTGAAATVPGSVMLSPPNKEIDVPLNTLVCATFDRDMETADMTAELMTLTPDSGSVIAAQVSYDAETATVCLAPSAALEIETTYTVVIAGTVRDSSGTALGADQTWSFTSGSASSPGLRFTDSCSDLATDSDADGLWDELSIEVGVEVLSDANYNLNGRLMDSAGQEIAWATTDNVYLTTGVHLLTLSFDSDGIRSNGSDGPYILADLQFYNAYNIDEYVWLSEACSTYPYSAAGFDAELTLTGLPDITLLPGESRADAFSLNEYAQHKILADDALQYEIEINTDTACGVAIDAEDNVDIYPAADWLGSSEVTVKVTGGSATARDTFRVTVTETITTTTTIPDSTTTTVPDFYECPPEAPVDCLNGYCCPEDQPYCGSGLMAGRCYTEPPETCPVVNLLGDNAGALDRLRAFRDSILSTTAAGERLTTRYYAHGSELTELLLQDKALRRQASAVLLRLLPAVTAALDGRGLTLKSEDSRAVDRLCSTISRRASASLTQALERLRSALREKRLAAELGLVPAKK